jgi:transcriptional regulator with XRE-family HTH domain
MSVTTNSNPLAQRLERITTLGGIRGRDVAQLLETTPETVSRWKAGKVEPQRDRLKRLLTLEWLMDELAQFYTPNEARLWLFSPHRLLGGQTPADKIQRGELDEVLAIVAQLRDGAYA